MPTQIETGLKKGSSGSGGILGAIGSVVGAGIGAVAGVLGAPFTAGASIPTLISAGAAAGGGIGGAVGTIADPAKADEKNAELGTAIERRATSAAGEVTAPSKVLQESLAALNSPSVPDSLKAQAKPVLEEAYGLATRKKRSPLAEGF